MYDLSRTKGSHVTKPAVAAVHNDRPFLLQQDMSKSVRQRLSQGLRERPDTELTNACESVHRARRRGERLHTL